MASTSPLKKLGWGFINQTYDLLIKSIDKETAIKQIIGGIKSNPKWFASIKAKAVERNIELDSVLRLEAEYLYKQR